MTSAVVAQHFDVSRETLERLEIYASELQKWNPRINLVSRKSIDDLWVRHILDSVQVFDVVQPKGSWVDIGSGGGLPGIVVAILAAEKRPDLDVTLIESDQRKCAFLRTAVRQCGVGASIITDRIENVPSRQSNVLSARALADLTPLLGFAKLHLRDDGVALLPKGAGWKKEVDNAREYWNFSYEPITSLTEPQAVILKIEGVERV